MSLILKVLILTIFYFEIIPNTYVFTRDNFQLNIFDDNYIDAAFVVEDGIKIDCDQSLRTYSMSYKFMSSVKQEEDLKKFDQKVKSISNFLLIRSVFNETFELNISYFDSFFLKMANI